MTAPRMSGKMEGGCLMSRISFDDWLARATSLGCTLLSLEAPTPGSTNVRLRVTIPNGSERVTEWARLRSM